ncbi:MAG: adenine-specific methyltransferase EcoRI family protein [Clostridiales bacterium]|nr:adenine-specific methyltransferase EcoRI family protein [Clostridiales bacterium]
MANNTNMIQAKKNKNDEFYTQYADIEAEMNAYVEYNPDVFRDKTILLPCDDPEWSNFTRYFALNFERFGLKKLISTSYAHSWGNQQISMFEMISPQFDETKHETRGKLFTLTKDTDNSGRIDTDDIEFNNYLEGDGDFRSEEVTALRDEADIIITNPPFSLFREFVVWILEGRKDFIIIGNQSAITNKEFFPFLQENRVWLGYSIHSGDRKFNVPDDYPLEASTCGVDPDGRKYIRVKGVRWFTNIEHGQRHEWLQLDTKEHNLKYNKKLKKHLAEYGYTDYPRYDNYDAIDVKFTECIPSDYDELMGVPITFMDKYNPDQFELVGIPTAGSNKDSLNLNNDYRTYIGYTQEGKPTGRTGSTFGACPVFERNDHKTIYYTNGKRTVQAGSCERIFIRRKER